MHNSRNNIPDLSKIKILEAYNLPRKPPKTVGFVEKSGLIYYNVRFLELDINGGSLKRFKDIDDYPTEP